MAAQNTTQSFGYTWGFADNSRGESVVEISPNINYTVSSQQDPQKTEETVAIWSLISHKVQVSLFSVQMSWEKQTIFECSCPYN